MSEYRAGRPIHGSGQKQEEKLQAFSQARRNRVFFLKVKGLPAIVDAFFWGDKKKEIFWSVPYSMTRTTFTSRSIRYLKSLNLNILKQKRLFYKENGRAERLLRLSLGRWIFLTMLSI